MREFVWRIQMFLERVWGAVRDFFMHILPNHSDSPETRNVKLAAFFFVGILGLMIVAGLTAFLLTVRGQEETLVPDVRDKELSAALIELQDKNLYPLVIVQFSSDVEKNVVMGQRPAPGTQVKSGKQVQLWISKGPVLDKVDNYVGKSLDEVRIYLQALFSTQKANIVIKEPILYQYDKTVPAGTIIAQKPKSGTAISGITYLELVVSRGSGASIVEVGDFEGKSFTEVINELTKSNIPFVFTARKAAKGDKPGIVVTQNPKPKTALGYGQPVRLEMTVPDNPGKDRVFGIFRYSLPDYPILMDVRVDVSSESGKGTLIEMKHPGGQIAIPYILPEDGELALFVMGKEQTREKAKAFAE